MKKFLYPILRRQAIKVLRKHKPMIIGITGSVGKTSTKEAIYACLKKFRSVEESPKNYNNEIGLPLSVLGLKSPGNSLFKWAGVLAQSILGRSSSEEYPEILVLEMAPDKPGDMDYLLSIARPKIGVLTQISHVHVEQFGTVENVAREKRKLLEALPDDGWAIVNGDDSIVMEAASYSKAPLYSYGFSENVDLRALDIQPRFNGENAGGDLDQMIGLGFKIQHEGSLIPFFIPGVLGDFQVYAALAGIACGLKLGLNPVDMADALREFNGPPGRMKVIIGIKDSIILDDTYNSSPLALDRALNVIGELKVSGTKFVVLGDMLELGALSQESHEQAGVKASKVANVLVTCGERSRDFDRGAQDAGFSKDYIFHFSTPEETGKFLQSRVKAGDLIFVKGSQGTRMEKVVKEIMAEPLRAGELLVRQDGGWV